MGSSVSTTPPSPPRWGMIAIAAVILVDLAKHTVLYLSGLDQPWPDSAGYWRLGTVVADGDFWMRGPALGYRTPGYPWFLGGVIGLLGTGAGFAAAILVQHVAAIATDFLVGWWTWRLTGSHRAALLAGTWMALSTARPLYANWILTESLATLLLMLAAFLIWSNRPPASWRLVTAALAAGSGILIRPSLLVLIPVLGMASLADGWRRPGSIGKRLAYASIPLAVVLAIMAPWCERNRQLFGRWALLTFTGRELWTANFSPWPGAGLDIPTEGPAEELHRRLAVAGSSVDLRHNTGVAAALIRSGLTDAEADRLMERVARQAILREPGRSIVHTAARMGTFWYCKEYPPPPAVESAEDGFARSPQPRFPAVSRLSTAILAWGPERTFLFTWIVSGLTWLGIAVCLLGPPRSDSARSDPARSPSPIPSTDAVSPPATQETRRAGWTIGLILAGTTFLTALLEIPLYRYRLPLEPLGVVAIVAGAMAFRSRFRAGTGLPSRTPGVPLGQDKPSPVH